jgi:hypothetical protein
MIAKISNPNRSLPLPQTTTKIPIITPKKIRRSLYHPPNLNPKKHPHHLKPRVLKLVNHKSRLQPQRKIHHLKRRNQKLKKLLLLNPKSRKKLSQLNPSLKNQVKIAKRKYKHQKSKNNKRR